jgi:hypothetical protein
MRADSKAEGHAEQVLYYATAGWVSLLSRKADMARGRISKGVASSNCLTSIVSRILVRRAQSSLQEFVFSDQAIEGIKDAVLFENITELVIETVINRFTIGNGTCPAEFRVQRTIRKLAQRQVNVHDILELSQ